MLAIIEFSGFQPFNASSKAPGVPSINKGIGGFWWLFYHSDHIVDASSRSLIFLNASSLNGLILSLISSAAFLSFSALS